MFLSSSNHLKLLQFSIFSSVALMSFLIEPPMAEAEDSNVQTESSTNVTYFITTRWAASVRAALARRALAHKRKSAWIQQGVASWYGNHFQGKRTSSGEAFNTNAMTAAHLTLPIGTSLRVTSEETGRSIVVRVNDRGPFNNRIIDLSHAAAERLGMLQAGTAHVTISPIVDDGTDEVAEAPTDDNARPLNARRRTRSSSHHMASSAYR